MERYYKLFSLVELNTTFYRYPRSSTVDGWRSKAPEEFEFSVKAHRDITHRFRFEPEASLKAYTQMKAVCEALKARALLFQTPRSFGPEKLDAATNFFEMIDRDNLAVVWETRGPAWSKPAVKEKLAEALKSLNITHVTDPFKATPVYTGGLAYFRLHGLGQRMYYYQYSDGELTALGRMVKQVYAGGKDVYVLFNNLAMLDDSLRFIHYLKTGSFRWVTEETGLDSAKAVLSRTRFPATKNELIKKLGWKLIELEEGTQVRLGELLKSVPPATYRNIEEVLRKLDL